MALVKVKGLISKEISYSDSDKMLTIITEDFGKISVMARNAKRMEPVHAMVPKC